MERWCSGANSVLFRNWKDKQLVVFDLVQKRTKFDDGIITEISIDYRF